jgi:DNA-binding transcriptional MerR regulator
VLTIGELARLAQVSTRSLRYYEEQGLLTPARTSEGHRRYPAGALRCVKLFKALFDAGMTSALVREAVAKWHANRTPPCAIWKGFSLRSLRAPASGYDSRHRESRLGKWGERDHAIKAGVCRQVGIAGL